MLDPPPPPMIEFLELHACSVRIKGRHALKWGKCSNSNTEQQYSIRAGGSNLTVARPFPKKGGPGVLSRKILEKCCLLVHFGTIVFSTSLVLVMNPLSVFTASLVLVMNPLSVFSASIVLVLSKRKSL